MFRGSQKSFYVGLLCIMDNLLLFFGYNRVSKLLYIIYMEISKIITRNPIPETENRSQKYKKPKISNLIPNLKYYPQTLVPNPTPTIQTPSQIPSLTPPPSPPGKGINYYTFQHRITPEIWVKVRFLTLILSHLLIKIHSKSTKNPQKVTYIFFKNI